MEEVESCGGQRLRAAGGSINVRVCDTARPALILLVHEISSIASDIVGILRRTGMTSTTTRPCFRKGPPAFGRGPSANASVFRFMQPVCLPRLELRLRRLCVSIYAASRRRLSVRFGTASRLFQSTGSSPAARSTSLQHTGLRPTRSATSSPRRSNLRQPCGRRISFRFDSYARHVVFQSTGFRPMATSSFRLPRTGRRSPLSPSPTVGLGRVPNRRRPIRQHLLSTSDSHRQGTIYASVPAHGKTAVPAVANRSGVGALPFLPTPPLPGDCCSPPAFRPLGQSAYCALFSCDSPVTGRKTPSPERTRRSGHPGREPAPRPLRIPNQPSRAMYDERINSSSRKYS